MFCSAASRLLERALVAILALPQTFGQVAPLDALKIAEQVADKSFRWWFLALLIIVLSGGLWALKYLIMQAKEDRAVCNTQIASLVTELSASRENHHSRLASMHAEALNMVREVVEVVSSTKAVIESNTRESGRVRDVIDALNRK